MLLGLNVTAHKKLREGDEYAGDIVPVYGATKDLPTRVIRTTIAKNLERLISERTDALPPAVARKHDFPPGADAWRGVHAPRELEDIDRGRRRIVFEEFFGVALAAALKRARREAAGGATPIAPPPDWWARSHARARRLRRPARKRA